MSIASSKARSRPSCQRKRRPSTSWRSILKPLRHWASQYRRQCSLVLTRSSNSWISAFGTKRTFDRLNQYPLSGVKRTLIGRAALLLLMLGAHTTVTPFHHQPEAQHPKIFQLSTSCRPITPSFDPKRPSPTPDLTTSSLPA